jgi:hypothetical protein
MNDFINNFSAHEAVVAGVAATAMHLVHLAWPNIKLAAAACARAYPWLADNGGICGAVKTALKGK